MENPGRELLFPPHILPLLKELEIPFWKNIVTEALDAGSDSLEQMGIILMLARMNNCASCNHDSHRALHGCAACSIQTLKRYHHSGDSLLGSYRSAKKEVEEFLNKEE
jgi:hypothetical protein